MKFAILGTGRSGTKWCATVLRNAGIYCGHEQVFKTGEMLTGPWPKWFDYQGDSSLAAVAWLPMRVKTILVIREPLACARSWAQNAGFLRGGLPNGMEPYLRRHHPEIFDEPDELSAALRYWLAWNRRALDHSDMVLRLEDLTAEGLVDAVGVEARWDGFPVEPLNVTNSGWVGDSYLLDEARRLYEATNIRSYG